MQNCYSIQPSLLSLATSNELPELDGDSSLCELLGDSSSFSYTPWTQDFTASIKDVNEDSWEASYIPRLVPRSQALGKAKPFSLLTRLKDLYHEEVRTTVSTPEGRTTSYLLSKITERDTFNIVIVTLYPINDGYSISFLLENGKILAEEAKYPYTQETLLEYIDSEQLPTPFLEYWEHSVPQLFYDGCVICRVKDLRHGAPASISHVLLRPHTQSIISDVNKLMIDSDVLWTPEDRFSMESDIINNANRSLCLDPNPEVGKKMLKLHQDRCTFDTTSIRKLLHRNSPLILSQKSKYDHFLPRFNPYLSDFLEKKKLNKTIAPKIITAQKSTKTSVPGFSSISPEAIEKGILDEFPFYKKILEKRDPKRNILNDEKRLCELPVSEDITPRLIKEWILKSKKEPHIHHVQLKILQNPVNFEYLCQIYMDNSYEESKSNGSSCKFILGSRANAHRFVEQYIEIYTGGCEGRQDVDIQTQTWSKD